MQNPLAKQDRIEQDFDGSFYLIRKASKSKDFSIDFDEGGRSRIQILQDRIWRKIRKRLLLGCSIRSCLAKWSNMWSSSIFTATGICRFRFAEPRQGVVAPSIFVLFSTTICGRSSREPTVIRGFRETRRRNKKITDSRLAIRYFWLRRRDLKACLNCKTPLFIRVCEYSLPIVPQKFLYTFQMSSSLFYG